MIPVDGLPGDPSMMLNQSGDALSPIVPIAITTPCPRCGSRTVDSSDHVMFDFDARILRHCGFYAVAGDTVWVNAMSCEKGDPTPFLRVRAETMQKLGILV